MTHTDYWHGDPWLCEDYRRAHRLKIEQRNQEMWLQGLYVYSAFETVLSNAFGKGKKAKYMEEPIRIFPMTEDERAERERQEWARIDAQLHAIMDAQRAKRKDV